MPPMSFDALVEEATNLRREVEDLHARVQYLIDNMPGVEEGCYTFPDGDMWWQTGKEPR